MELKTKISDSELISSSKDGCRAAFDMLVDRYRSKVESHLTHYSHCKADTEDITQETFIKAFTKLDKYKENTSFGAWLNSIAKNTFIDHKRKQHSKQDIEISEYKLNSIFEEAEEGWESKEVKFSAIEKSIEGLTKEYRKVLELRFYYALSYEEISEKLAVPIGTIKTWVRRAKIELKKQHDQTII